MTDDERHAEVMQKLASIERTLDAILALVRTLLRERQVHENT